MFIKSDTSLNEMISMYAKALSDCCIATRTVREEVKQVQHSDRQPVSFGYKMTYLCTSVQQFIWVIRSYIQLYNINEKKNQPNTIVSKRNDLILDVWNVLAQLHKIIEHS